MSIPFSDTSTLKGLVQFYELEIGASQGDVSGSTSRLKAFAAYANLAFDEYLGVAFPKSGTWKLDDSNQTDYPEIKTNLVASQRDYIFTTDENGNVILDIYRVYAKDSAVGYYRLLLPVDPDSQDDMASFYDGRNQTGIPTRYDKTANGILLDCIPSYSATDGLKLSINREASYFVYTDTTKKPGVCGLHHEYFFLKPAQAYARRNTLKSANRIDIAVAALERQIGDYYTLRTRDEKPRLSARQESNK